MGSIRLMHWWVLGDFSLKIWQFSVSIEISCIMVILKNNIHWNFAIDDVLCSNLTLCCEINVHINDVIAQQSIVLICISLNFFLQFQEKDHEVLHLMIICPWHFTHTKIKPSITNFLTKFSIFLKVKEFKCDDF
jgi:hypothetical protein